MIAQAKLIEKAASLESISGPLASPSVARALSFDNGSQSPPSSSNPKTQRKKVFTEEEKSVISQMSEPSEMDSADSRLVMLRCAYLHKERKRQYEALRRVLKKEASPALTMKFNMCSDKERLLDFPSVTFSSCLGSPC